MGEKKKNQSHTIHKIYVVRHKGLCPREKMSKRNLLNKI
jgi:hypothetical protein